MSTNRIFVVGLVGASSSQMADAIGYAGNGSDAEWIRLWDRLRSQATKPPVLAYCEYIEQWEMSSALVDWSLIDINVAAWPSATLRANAGDYDVIGYGEGLYSQLLDAHASRSVNGPPGTEMKRYGHILCDTIEIVRPWSPSLVMSVFECLGGSAYDDEIEMSLARNLLLE